MSLPYWYDKLETFFYIPENNMITLEEAYQKYAITSNQIMQCKAWWNTNIPMDNFLPILIPTDTKDSSFKACLNNFIERIQQRSTGIQMPVPLEVNVKAGIIVLDADNDIITAIIINHPNDPTNLILFNIDNNGHGNYNVNTPLIPGETIERNESMVYWDMIEQKYV